MRITSMLCFMAVFVSACQSAPERPANLTDCQGARPQVCTMIYAPVCAMEDDGQFRSYSSDCTACSHEEVIGYQQGACPEKK